MIYFWTKGRVIRPLRLSDMGGKFFPVDVPDFTAIPLPLREVADPSWDRTSSESVPQLLRKPPCPLLPAEKIGELAICPA
ncbi:hypothetical protein [Asaia spathodeae]|uniref:Uncharacterized protein n=1 Tax=Asaia spathodeae TaxID=657016 RepID=A0ABX2P405_9PROT|nr:hypothetical protein [Asaia spathodeae]GBR22522.1 hypothetical protein AA105894_3076 [Asaia spathodeae NBRC 105894]